MLLIVGREAHLCPRIHGERCRRISACEASTSPRSTRKPTISHRPFISSFARCCRGRGSTYTTKHYTLGLAPERTVCGSSACATSSPITSSLSAAAASDADPRRPGRSSRRSILQVANIRSRAAFIPISATTRDDAYHAGKDGKAAIDTMNATFDGRDRRRQRRIDRRRLVPRLARKMTVRLGGIALDA